MESTHGRSGLHMGAAARTWAQRLAHERSGLHMGAAAARTWAQLLFPLD